MSPFLILSHKPERSFYCPKGCCNEGRSWEIMKIAVFDDKEKAAEHIASLDLAQQAAQIEEPRDDSFIHRMLKIENLQEHIGQVWDEISGIPHDYYDKDFVEITEIAHQKVKKSNEAAAAIVAAEKLAAEESKKKEEELEAARAAKEKEEWDKAEFERLKQKFQS